MNALPKNRRYVVVKSDQSLGFGVEALPSLEPDQVLIKVEGIGINRGDLLQRMGLYPPPPGVSPIMGLEASGEIVAIGDEVDSHKVGEKVCALMPGAAYCDYTVAQAGLCLPIPKGLTVLQGAALPETVFTVWQTVFKRCLLKAGENFLVHGGSSGIGTTAIQMAKAMGARPYTTAGSDEKCRACEALGAVKAVNYKTQDFEDSLPPMDVILDMVGGDFIQKNINLLADEGRLNSIAFIRGFEAQINFVPMILKRLTITGSTLRALSSEQKSIMAKEIARHIWPEIEQGAIKPVIDSVYAFEDVAKAHERMKSGEHIGKILLHLGKDETLK